MLSHRRLAYAVVGISAAALIAAGAVGWYLSSVHRNNEPAIFGTWVLEGLTIDGRSLHPVPDRPTTINISADEVGGTLVCNTYGTSFEGSPDQLRVQPIAMTLRTCREDTRNLEDDYPKALIRVVHAEVTDSELLLLGPGVEMRFARGS